MTFRVFVEFILLMDIIFKCLTTFQKDNVWETSLLEIVKNYALKGTMVTDICGTLPTLVTNQSASSYLWKLFRLTKTPQVLGTISDITNHVLIRAGFYKGSIGKIVFALMLIVYLVAACHFIGCAWISIAKITPCSWIE